MTGQGTGLRVAVAVGVLSPLRRPLVPAPPSPKGGKDPDPPVWGPGPTRLPPSSPSPRDVQEQPCKRRPTPAPQARGSRERGRHPGLGEAWRKERPQWTLKPDDLRTGAPPLLPFLVGGAFILAPQCELRETQSVQDVHYVLGTLLKLFVIISYT